MSSLGKKGKRRFSRGYCGYHITWEGNKVYLRSRLEFLYATWLDYKKVRYKVEVCFYEIDGRNYKPDFFIYNSFGALLRIIEIKGGKDEKQEYLNMFCSFFKNILEISYEVFDSSDLYKLTKEIPEIKQKTENWISYCVENENTFDMRGKNNPRYGSHGTLEGNKKISESNKKTKSDPLWRKEQSIKKKAFFKTEAGRQAIEKRRKKMLENGIIIRERNRIEREKSCPICGTTFDTYNKTCSSDCSNKLKSVNANHPEYTNEQIKSRMRTKLKNICNKIMKEYKLSIAEFFNDPDSFFKKAKQEGIIYNKMGISLNALNKYDVKESLWEN